MLLKEVSEDTFMKAVLEGAFQVGESNNSIRGNLCAAALREAVGHVLHTLAPDDKLSNCIWYKKEPNTNGPTRQQRATYILQGGLSIEFVRETLELDHKTVCSPLIEAMGKLNRATHVRKETILDDDKEIRAMVDHTFNGLLELFKAARKCQQEVHQQLANEIHDAVLDAFLSETLQELDELSTHTTFDEHVLDDVDVTCIDDKFIHFAAKGTVYIQLQYGSNSDVRNDMGALMSDSYPYVARMRSKVQKPNEIIRDDVEISVDTSRFYE